jgi:glucose-6-phosphate isomerase
MPERIRFDYNNMMAENIGTRMGLTAEELEGYKEAAKKIHADMTKRRKENALPFYELPYNKEIVNSIKTAASELMKKFDTQVVIGIGGSALGPAALLSGLKHSYFNELPADKRDGMRTYFTDNIDPDTTVDLMEMIDPKKTVFLVVTKSGSTPETITSFFILKKFIIDTVGEANYKDHLIFVTDPEKGALREILNKEGGIRQFPIEPLVGGRFSVLTPVGLLPAALRASISNSCLLSGGDGQVDDDGRPDEEPRISYAACSMPHISTARTFPC